MTDVVVWFDDSVCHDVRVSGGKGASLAAMAAAGLNVGQIGILSFAYPAVWGILQPWTGALSDRWGRRRTIAAGWGVFAVSYAGFAWASSPGRATRSS